ncbi:helix-turn-helix domain-containing protein [Ideonella sp. DXS22W]|uniref:Helix-turn-helix domain-containing protein n=1 Tax=Pseudaquabacterium inlustre TaxID=2984192 RepID=A0ABU9CJ31_9BURK
MTFDPDASRAAELAFPATAGDPCAGRPEPGPPDHYCRVAQGFLYASTRLPPVRTQRPAAVLLLAVAAHELFGIETARRGLRCGAAAVQPLVARRLLAQGVPLVSLNLHPEHAGFLRWRGIAGDGVLPLSRAAFAAHDAHLAAMARGLPDRASGQALCDALLATLHPLLPPVGADPPLRATLLQWLRVEPELGLPELARRLGISYHRMSHCFSQALGVPYRHWRAYARAQRAAAQFKAARTLTGIAHEAGFTDSAHLSHTWQRTYGLSPSFVRHDNSVQAIL